MQYRVVKRRRLNRGRTDEVRKGHLISWSLLYQYITVYKSFWQFKQLFIYNHFIARITITGINNSYVYVVSLLNLTMRYQDC